MKIEDHPKYGEWRDALDAMVDAEVRHFQAIATNQPEEEQRLTQATLHRARQVFWDVADNLVTGKV